MKQIATALVQAQKAFAPAFKERLQPAFQKQVCRSSRLR
jgi:hypothetical protein